MSQSPSFNDRIRQIKEGNPTKHTLPQENTFHSGSQSSKKLVILWPQTGRRKALKYVDLNDVDLDISGDMHVMKLLFYTCTLTLKGYKLDILFDWLLLDGPYVVVVQDQRYTALSQQDQYVVTEAIVK